MILERWCTFHGMKTTKLMFHAVKLFFFKNCYLRCRQFSCVKSFCCCVCQTSCESQIWLSATGRRLPLRTWRNQLRWQRRLDIFLAIDDKQKLIFRSLETLSWAHPPDAHPNMAKGSAATLHWPRVMSEISHFWARLVERVMPNATGETACVGLCVTEYLISAHIPVGV